MRAAAAIARSGARAALAVLTLAALALAAPAPADQAPAFTTGPTIGGQAIVGAQLHVIATWTGVPAPTALYEWERCDAAGLSCAPVEGACGAAYTPALEDFGDSLRARVDLWNPAGAVTARTPLSDPVFGVPGSLPGAAPRASSCTAVAPAGPPTPAPAPVLAAAPLPSVSTAPVAARVAYMRPFPVVRIRGYLAAGGTRITLLSIRGPRSARVRAACAGEGCPRHPPTASLAVPTRLRAFERLLPAGTVLRIRVTSASAIGKYTSFRILARRAPQRADRCLVPGRWAPAPCPEA